MQQKNTTKVIFSDRLRFLMAEKGVTQQQLAAGVGLSQPAIGKYLKGTMPGASDFFKIAQFFGKTMESFFVQEDENPQETRTPPQNKVSEAPQLWNGPYYGASDGAPIVSWASAGSSHAWEDQGDDVPRVKTNCKDHNCYALALVGDSMTPIYQPGDIIVCSPNLEAQPMDLIMLKTKSDDIYFKRYLGEKRGVHRFESYNPNYPIMEFEPKEIDKIHVVHSVVRIFKGRFF